MSRCFGDVRGRERDGREWFNRLPPLYNRSPSISHRNVPLVRSSPYISPFALVIRRLTNNAPLSPSPMETEPSLVSLFLLPPRNVTAANQTSPSYRPTTAILPSPPSLGPFRYFRTLFSFSLRVRSRAYMCRKDVRVGRRSTRAQKPTVSPFEHHFPVGVFDRPAVVKPPTQQRVERGARVAL